MARSLDHIADILRVLQEPMLAGSTQETRTGEMNMDTKKPGHGMDLETENLTTILWFLRTQMEVHAPHVFDESVWDAFERRALRGDVHPARRPTKFAVGEAVMFADKRNRVHSTGFPVMSVIDEEHLVWMVLEEHLTRCDPDEGDEDDEDDIHTPHPHGPDLGDPVAHECHGDRRNCATCVTAEIEEKLKAAQDCNCSLKGDLWKAPEQHATTCQIRLPVCRCKSLLAGHETGCPHAPTQLNTETVLRDRFVTG